jgi:acetate kinase
MATVIRSTEEKTMKKALILTINGGSSSIKFALYQVGEPLKRGLCGKVDRIGLSGTNLTPEVLGKLVALYDRFSWRGDSDFANRVLSAMRKQFGRHDEKKKGGS